MKRRVKPAARPRYQQVYPEPLSTSAQLAALGLRPGTGEPDAILENRQWDGSGICGGTSEPMSYRWRLGTSGPGRTQWGVIHNCG